MRKHNDPVETIEEPVIFYVFNLPTEINFHAKHRLERSAYFNRWHNRHMKTKYFKQRDSIKK